MKTSGDMKLQAGSDIDLISLNNITTNIGNNFNATCTNNMNLRSGGIMKLFDSSRTSGVTLADLQQEVIHKEIYFNGAVSSGGNNRRLNVFEQSFTGTHTRDFLEIWIDFLVQDSAGNDPLDWQFYLQLQEDGGGYVSKRLYSVQLDEVNSGDVGGTSIVGITPPFSVPLTGYYVENIGIASVDTRLLQVTGGQGITLNSASSFRMRHSTKYHDFTVETGGSWEEVS